MNFCARMSPTVKPVREVRALTTRGLLARALLYAAHIPDMVKVQEVRFVAQKVMKYVRLLTLVVSREVVR